MNQAYLNGQYSTLDEARISPLDRGFLFGDGVYEVIPCYDKRFVGWQQHITRMQHGLAQLQIDLGKSATELRDIANQIVAASSDADVGLYIQVTRGAAPVRKHSFPENIEPTLFMTCFAIPGLATNPQDMIGSAVQTEQDIRWKRCDLKSVSLLGSVLHFQSAQEKGLQETLLVDDKNHVTEASTSNVFIVKDGTIVTPPLSNELLPGITRDILLHIIQQHTSYQLVEQPISLDTLYQADECWITSSSRGVVPITECDGKVLSDGKVGPVAKELACLYCEHLFEY
ncbi:MAG: aminotransferase class IV [Aestuariibacter sp.]